ncbi:protein of unknown function [Aminobacter niigataensis]|nr:protein of unknown function [Aminobacter niigataensis]
MVGCASFDKLRMRTVDAISLSSNLSILTQAAPNVGSTEGPHPELVEGRTPKQPRLDTGFPEPAPASAPPPRTLSLSLSLTLPKGEPAGSNSKDERTTSRHFRETVFSPDVAFLTSESWQARQPAL